MIASVLAQFGDSFWMPTDASTYAFRVDRLFYFILAIATFFFALITVLMVLFVVRYRRRDGRIPAPSASHNTALELTWTIIPAILVVLIFVFGLKGYMDMATPPANALDITVTAFKWAWAFTYPNGHVDANLHVPVDRPVRLTLTSQDVIHSLYIPAFRIKKDCVPGRFNRMWFEATKVNDTEGYDLFCAEYCGTSHSAMVAKVYVHDAAGFQRWLEEASRWEGRIAPVQRGAQLYEQRGCRQCHSIDGSRVIGPSFRNAWDEIVEGRRAFADGRRLADLLGEGYTAEDYVRESIYEPGARIVAGYAGVAMPGYRGQVRDNDIPAIIAWLKSLSDRYRSEADLPAAATSPASAPDKGGAR